MPTKAWSRCWSSSGVWQGASCPAWSGQPKTCWSGSWVAGMFGARGRERSVEEMPGGGDFMSRLRQEMGRARREQRGALALVRPTAREPLGERLDAVAQLLEDHMRPRDTVGIMSDEG